MNDVVALARRHRNQPAWAYGPRTQTLSLDAAAVEALIPHRAPLRLVDRVSAVDFELKAVHAEQGVDADSPVFAGHFPGQPVYPGALQIELIAQAALCYIELERARTESKRPFSARALKVHYAEFLRELNPPAAIAAWVRELEDSGFTRTFLGQLTSAGTPRSIAIVEVYLGE